MAELRTAAARLPQSAEAHAELGVRWETAGISRRRFENWRRRSSSTAATPADFTISAPPGLRRRSRLRPRPLPNITAAWIALWPRCAALTSWTPPCLTFTICWAGSINKSATFTSAELEFRQAVQAEPGSAQAYNNLGTALRQEENYPESLRAYQKAVTLNPRMSRAYLNLAAAIQASGTQKAMLQQSLAAVQSQPASGASHVLLGQALLLNDQPEAAEAELRKAIELAPDLPIAHFYLGQALHRGEKVSEAVPHLSQAVIQSPDIPEFRVELGAALLKVARFDDAIAALRRAVEINPADGPARYVLARALQRSGRDEEAKKEFAEAASLNQSKHRSEQAGLLTANAIADLRAGKLQDAVRKTAAGTGEQARLSGGSLLSRNRAGTIRRRRRRHRVVPVGFATETAERRDSLQLRNRVVADGQGIRSAPGVSIGRGTKPLRRPRSLRAWQSPSQPRPNAGGRKCFAAGTRTRRVSTRSGQPNAIVTECVRLRVTHSPSLVSSPAVRHWAPPGELYQSL